MMRKLGRPLIHFMAQSLRHEAHRAIIIRLTAFPSGI
jgi:hypothetical protein